MFHLQGEGMMKPQNSAEKETIWFVYDGECPLCKAGATAYRIKQSVGDLQTLDKRTADSNHPIIAAIRVEGLDLNQGMVIAYGGRFYQGADALHLMAVIGAEDSCLSKISARIFRSPRRAKLCYPFLRGARNMLLAFKGVSQIKEPEIHGQNG
jgi:predicted DCC family thiol-disulfide oxidoreductase YuxK